MFWKKTYCFSLKGFFALLFDIRHFGVFLVWFALISEVLSRCALFEAMTRPSNQQEPTHHPTHPPQTMPTDLVHKVETKTRLIIFPYQTWASNARKPMKTSTNPMKHHKNHRKTHEKSWKIGKSKKTHDTS